MKPVRVLHITEELSAAGIESFIMNIYRRIDKSKVQFDFLVLRNQNEFYDDEIKSLGGVKYTISPKSSNILCRVYEESYLVERFLKNNHYDIVHVHYTTPLRAPLLKGIKNANVNTRIYHSHSAYVLGKSRLKLFIYSYMSKKITKHATHYFACSNAAGEWIFEEKIVKEGKVKVIYNGIDTNRFAYEPQKRSNIRKELGVTSEFLIIHTGRFTEQKNQHFIVEVFAEFLSMNPQSRLLLLGKGELEDSVRKQIQQLGVEDKVFMLGVKSNVEDYLSAADLYIMPSLYEGLPVAAVEAQCSGLPCILSSNITKEVKLTDAVEFLSLESSKSQWCDAIKSKMYKTRSDCSLSVKKQGYDVQEVSNRLQDFYEKRGEKND